MTNSNNDPFGLTIFEKHAMNTTYKLALAIYGVPLALNKVWNTLILLGIERVNREVDIETERSSAWEHTRVQ